MTTIAEVIAALPGPEFDAFRYPSDYAVQLAIERADVVPVEHVDAAREEVRAQLRPGVKRGPEMRAVLHNALRRWSVAESEELDAVYLAMADKYLELHSIVRS